MALSISSTSVSNYARRLKLPPQSKHLPLSNAQRERLREMRAVYGKDKVLLGKEGFTSLVKPHCVGAVAAENHLNRYDRRSCSVTHEQG